VITPFWVSAGRGFHETEKETADVPAVVMLVGAALGTA